MLAQQAPERPAQYARAGAHGAIAAGSGYATDAAMRMYYMGGNAVDAGVAAIFAAATTEYSHVGWGGEAPILIRTKDGKVHSIAGVGTMPKLASAEFYRNRPLRLGEPGAGAAREERSQGNHPGRGRYGGAGAKPAARRRSSHCATTAPKSFTEVVTPALEIRRRLGHR